MKRFLGEAEPDKLIETGVETVILIELKKLY